MPIPSSQNVYKLNSIPFIKKIDEQSESGRAIWGVWSCYEQRVASILKDLLWTKSLKMGGHRGQQ